MTRRRATIGLVGLVGLASSCGPTATDRSVSAVETRTSVSSAPTPTSQPPPAPSTSTAPTTAAPPTTTAPADLTSTAGIAAELARVELAIRAVAPDDPEASRLGRAQQRAYRALADHPEWDAEVVVMVPDSVRSAVELNIEARRAVVDHAATRAPRPLPATLPAWTIAAPLPVTQLLDVYRAAEAESGVPWGYLAAINFVETRFGRIVGASADGALGPMQFLPTTWSECCTGDITDPRDAIFGAARYLASNGAPGDPLGALYAYNPNDGYVGAVDAYARNLLADERALVGYHGWDVYVSSSVGSVLLPIGYSATEPIDAATYLAERPEEPSG